MLQGNRDLRDNVHGGRGYEAINSTGGWLNAKWSQDYSIINIIPTIWQDEEVQETALNSTTARALLLFLALERENRSPMNKLTFMSQKGMNRTPAYTSTSSGRRKVLVVDILRGEKKKSNSP